MPPCALWEVIVITREQGDLRGPRSGGGWCLFDDLAEFDVPELDHRLGVGAPLTEDDPSVGINPDTPVAGSVTSPDYGRTAWISSDGA